MSKPTRIKAVANGFFIGAPLFILGAYAAVDMFVKSIASKPEYFDQLGDAGTALMYTIGILAIVIGTTIPFCISSSSRTYKATHLLSSGAGLTAATLATNALNFIRLPIGPFTVLGS